MTIGRQSVGNAHSKKTGLETKNNLEEVKAIALRFRTEGWGTNPNWQDVWDEVVDPNVVHHFNDEPEPIIGLGNNKAFNASLFTGFPEITSTLETVVAEDNQVVYRSVLSGQHKGEFMGVPPTGKWVEVTDFTLVSVRERKIVEWWYTCNLLKVLQQIGVVD